MCSVGVYSYFQKGLPHLPHQQVLRVGLARRTFITWTTSAASRLNRWKYVDITAVIETKTKMLECHQSQLKAMKELAARTSWR